MLQQKLLTLSDLLVIAPVQINPQAEEAERIIEDYCRKLGIWLPHFQEYTTMSSYLFPRASVERLVAIDIFTNLLYFIDDVFDRNKPSQVGEIEMRKVFENCVAAMQYGIVPEDDHMLYATCLELHRQFAALNSQAWIDRLTDSLLQHFKATTYSIDDILKLGGDAVTQYIAIRELDSGMRPTMSLIELAYGIYLPDEVLNHTVIRRLTLRTARVGGLMNDIFSYEKEVLALGSRFNLIAVLMESQHLSFDEAVHVAVGMLNEFIAGFLEMENELPTWDDPKTNRLVQQFVEGLKDQIIATWHWQMSTNRYRSPNSPFPELRTLL